MSEQDRRTFLRRAGTVAWSTPLILTLASSRAGAQSCSPAGTACGTWNSTVEVCLPLGQTPVICCNGCERGTGQNGQSETFCYCAA